jgi:hypothetical protein
MTMDDAQLIEQFEAVTLDGLSHLEHVRLVWLYAQRDGLDQAYPRVRAGLIRFTTVRGSAASFHVTRTWAWAALIVAAIASSPAATYTEFLAEHPEFERKDLLSDYYTTELLTSETARAEVVHPDLRPIQP